MFEHGGADADGLVGVCDDHGYFCGVSGTVAGEATYGGYGVGPVGLLENGGQGDFAVEVQEAGSSQALVAGSAGEFVLEEVAAVDGFLGQEFVEFDHKGFVFGADGPKDAFKAVFEGFMPDILGGIGPDGGAWEVVVGDEGAVKVYIAIGDQYFIAGDMEGVDGEAADEGLLDD